MTQIRDRVVARHLSASTISLVNSVQTYASQLELHTSTIQALMQAGEARRLQRMNLDAVVVHRFDASLIEAKVKGTEGVYNTRITFTPKRGHRCTCPDWQRSGLRVGPCKHVLALGAKWMDDFVTPAKERLDDTISTILERAIF